MNSKQQRSVIIFVLRRENTIKIIFDFFSCAFKYMVYERDNFGKSVIQTVLKSEIVVKRTQLTSTQFLLPSINKIPH